MTFRSDLERLPREVWILLFGTFVNRFGTFVMPFLVLYLTRIGYSAAQAGLAIAAYGVGHIVASTAGGHLADRAGRRHTIVISMFGSAASMLALSQARGFAAIALLTAVTGAFSELYRPASHALIADLTTEDQRVLSYALYRFAVNLGVAAGPATAGFLAERSFTWLFVGDALTSIGYGIIAIAALPHGLRSPARSERKGEALRVVLRDRPFLLFLAATLCITLVDFQLGSTYALYVTSLGYAPRMYGMLVSFNGLLIILFELLITNWVQRFRPEPVIAIGYLLNNVGFAVTGLARRFPALLAAMSVWTVGEMVSSPMAGAFVAKLAPERLRGRYMGLLVLMWSIGMMIGPPIGTLLFARHREMLWIGAAALGALSAALLIASGRMRGAVLSPES
jgi:MFS family permease